MDNPDSEMVFYLMLRAVDRFYQQHSRNPGMRGWIIKQQKRSFSSVEGIGLILSVDVSIYVKPLGCFPLEIMLLAFLLFPCVPFLGVYNYQVEEDISKLKLCVNSLLQEYNLNVNIKDDYIHEL